MRPQGRGPRHYHAGKCKGETSAAIPLERRADREDCAQYKICRDRAAKLNSRFVCSADCDRFVPAEASKPGLLKSNWSVAPGRRVA